MLVFVEEEKPENPKKNPLIKARTNRKLNPHQTAGTGIDPDRLTQLKARAYPLCEPCSVRWNTILTQQHANHWPGIQEFIVITNVACQTIKCLSEMYECR